MISTIFWAWFVGLTLAFLLFAAGISLLMARLEKWPKRRIASRRLPPAPAPSPLYHMPGCLCLLRSDGTLAYASRDCKNLTKLAIAIERKRLATQKNEPGANRARTKTLN